MRKFRIYGSALVDIDVEVEANTFEEAMAIVDTDVYVQSYVDSVGIEVTADEIHDYSIDSSCDIEWTEEYSELLDEKGYAIKRYRDFTEEELYGETN